MRDFPRSTRTTTAPERPARRRRLGRLARTVSVPLLLAAIVTAGSPGWGSYTIRRGDNLESIAKRYHTTVARLIQANRLPGNGNLIYAGETLRVPVRGSHSRTVTIRRTHTVLRGDSLIRIARR